MPRFNESTPSALARRLWAISLTGVPFAFFKIGGGFAASQDIHLFAGWGIVAWGVLDVFLNMACLLRPNRFSYCLLSTVGREFDRRGRRGYEQLGLAFDTLLAFVIVSTMIWFGRTAALPAPMPLLWKLAVIASILGVGIEHVWMSYRHAHKKEV